MTASLNGRTSGDCAPFHSGKRRLSSVLSEIRRLLGSSQGYVSSIRIRTPRVAANCLIAVAGLAAAPLFGGDLPTGGDIVAGHAVISATEHTLNVDVASSRAVINWDSFSIGAGHSANFQLPDSTAAVLNRVTSAQMPSTISGALNSNGNILLVNPSGIVVSSSGTVNTNGFAASVFDIGDAEFMKGGALHFNNNGSNAAVTNQGTIATGNGGAHLIANQISNEGSITSLGGNITLSGGGEVTLQDGVTYVQPTLETLAGGISPTAGLIQNTGSIRATGAATAGGEVYLVNPNGKILHDGTITAGQTAIADAQQNIVQPATTPVEGGRVQLEADNISLTENSTIDASGANGGGEVLIGGDWQGTGDMHQATRVAIAEGAKVDASATTQGDGGTIVAWSNVNERESVTSVHGTLSATGGVNGGNGGRIETSGHRLDVSGIIANARAYAGKAGAWLLDPYSLTVTNSATNTTIVAPPLGFISSSGGTNVAASDIEAALNTGSSVYLQTSGTDGDGNGAGNINVNVDITKSAGGNTSLSLYAHKDIVIANNVAISSSSGELAITLKADSDSTNG
ncbi:MAG: filamentous hemagglutinin N-terminal domain-containing protein, partial [Planctomycetaceae bacterium]|nr:filamentous hemagglutinin N-terminal domain-containing protein [Planctomycetaceae bacterium]